MKTRPTGFTLIELLVVIAIIAILAAILFPIFISAKTSATTSKCMSNIKQVGVAMLMYADANDGRLPPYSRFTGPSRLLWSEFIKPYLKADRVYRCTALSSYEDNTGQYDAKATARVFGFGVPYPHLFDPGKPPTRMSAVPRNSKTMLMCDSYTMSFNWDSRTMVEAGYPVVYCRACGDWGYQDERPDGNVAGRHGGRSDTKPHGKTTVLYCDLHTKALDKERVIQKYGSAAESKNSDMWGHFDNIQH